MSDNTIKQKLTLNKYLANLLYLVLILLDIFIVATIVYVSRMQMDTVPLFFLEFQRSAFCGMMISMLMITLILLTLFYSTKGFITSSGLYIAYVIYTLLTASKIVDNSFYTGLIMITIGYITCALLHYNQKNLQKKNKLLENQKSILNKIAYYDSLTNLPNKNRILSELNTITEHANSDSDSFSIIRIDIDNYRVLRDYLGHTRGEKELKIFADHLNSITHPLDLAGRMDNDEFIVLVKRPLSKEELIDYVLLFKQELSHKITCNQNSFYLNCNFGISIFPDHDTKTEQLLNYADTACYEAKKDSDNRICFFNHSLYEQLIFKTEIENALQEAIHNDELYLVYQPQYSCDTKQLRGFEVLLRWNNPALGLIPPSTFIPIAEETGTIIPIGKWVMEKACESFLNILQEFKIELVLSVNISAIQLLENSFIDTVTDILETTGFPPELLEFEITETVLITSKETVISILNELKQMGIHLALDDFGTEYASLSYLQLLPLDILKIDRSFIANIGKESKDNLVESIIAIAQKQSLITVAEGIETEHQLNYLKEKGCQFIQGFLWGKPMSKDDMQKLLTELNTQETL